MSLRADDLWAAIDQLAHEHGWTNSGLARKAGLDPTAFNRSKRHIRGHDRWPASSSIAKVLDATGESFMEFAARVIMINQARQAPDSFAEGEPAGSSNAVPRTRTVSQATTGRA